MAFISYSQNFEDVLLHRAFGNVEAGTYIDVGAGDPVIDSVTKAFYDTGWSGINIEPLPRFFERLVAQRERDANLAVVLSDHEGMNTFFAVEGYEELSTTVPEIAAGYVDSGRAIVEFTVPSRTLASVCEELAPETIHFLKVDVEGAELSVLLGADFRRFRPKIVIVEVVSFGNTSSEEPEWNALLVNADYSSVYFDGLNRFYVADEHLEELAPCFEVPVNVRDDFTRPFRLRGQLALKRIAEVLGLAEYSDEHEVLERVEGLRADRIAFEKRADVTLAELATTRGQLSAAQATVEGQAGEMRRLRIEVEAFQQQQFERERYVAWQSTEIQRAHERAAASEAAAAHAAEQVADVFRSRSWRISLPLRVLRRPAPYLRKLAGR